MAKTKAQKQAYNQMLSDAYDQIAGALGKQSATPTQTTTQQSNTYTPTLSKDEVGKMYDDYMASLNSQNNTPSIPKLEDMGQNNSAPSASVSLPNLSDLRSQLADTTTNRTEGETKALQDYIQGIETLQQNTYKQNYNDEINKVRNRLDTDVNLTDGERKANEEYLSGLQTLQAEIDRYNRPKYTSNNTSTTNNAKQKKSKYEGKNIHIAESEKDKQLNEADIVEINGQYYTKQALADQRQANRERVRENKLMKSESDSVKGFIKKFESANAQLLNNQVKAAYQMGKDKINEENNANKVLNLQNKTEPYTEKEAKTLLSNLSPEDLNIVKGWATYPEYDVDELVKNTDWTIDKLNKYADAYNVANGDAQTYDANKFQKWSNSRYNLSVANGEIRNQYDKATQKAFEDGNNDALMQVFASLDDHSKQVIQQDYDEQKASKDGKAFNRDIYLNKLMEDNPGMTEETATKFLDNAKTFVDDSDVVDKYFRENVDKWLDPNYTISPYEEYMFKKYTEEILPNKYPGFEDDWDDHYTRRRTDNLSLLLGKATKLKADTSNGNLEYFNKLADVFDKLDNNEAIMQGFGKAVPFGRQLEGLALDMMGYNDEQKQAWYNNPSHQSATQNPYASLYGQLPVELGKYMVAGEALESIPALAKLGDKIGGLVKGESALANGVRSHLGNIVNDTMVDVAVDTIPSLAQDIADGKSVGDIALNTLENIGTNVGFNLFSDLLLSKGGYTNNSLVRETLDDMDNARIDKVAFNNPKVEQATEKAMLDLGIVKDEADAILKADNVVANATDTTNNVVDTLAKQEDEIRNIGNQVQDTIDNIPKVEPVDVQLSPEDLTSLKTDFNSFSKSLNGKFNWYKLNNNPDVINVKEAMANFKKNPSKESWDEFVESYNTFAKNIENKPVYRPHVTDRTKSKWGDWDAYGDVQKQIDGLSSKYGFNNNTNIPKADDIAKASSQTPINNPVDMPNANAVDNNVADDLVKQNPKDYGYSQVYTNTGQKNGFVDMNNNRDRLNAIYQIKHDDELIGNAEKILENPNFRTDVIQGRQMIDSDNMVVATQVELGKITDEIKALDPTNPSDIAKISNLTAQKDLLMKRLREAGTDTGRELRAFGYLNNTPDGAIVNTQRFMDNISTTQVKKNGGKVNNSISKTAETLANTPNISANEVKNLLDANVFKDFGDEDYQFIANLVGNGATTKEIKDMLNFRRANGMWDIPDDVIQRVNEGYKELANLTEGSEAYIKKQTEIMWDLANSTKASSSLADKFDAWRYLAMLGNPKTHARNIVGNTMFQAVTSMSNTLAATMESALSKMGLKFDRTKAVLNPVNDLDLISASWKDSVNSRAYADLTGNKYNENIGRSIKNQKEVFDSKAMRKVNNFNSNALDTEDVFSMRFKYQTSLAGYLKANGYDKTIFDAENELKALNDLSKTSVLTPEQVAKQKELTQQVADLNKARDYAIEQAKYSAFHSDSELADAISGFASSGKNAGVKALNFIKEGVLPFRKTPINILKAGAEYSPLNAIKNFTYDAYQVAKGNMSASKLIENISKTLTGSGITFLGAYLYNEGILNINDGADQWQKNLEGIQNYSIQIGNKTYTIDSLAPSVMPLFMGVEIGKLWDEYFNAKYYDEDGNLIEKPEEIGKTFGQFFSDMYSAAGNLFSPIVETSMLSGLTDTISAIGDGETNSERALNLIGTPIASYFSQAIPTIGGQVARTIDPIRRSTYTGTNSGFDKTIQKTMNKIPFLSMLNEPYVDARGNTQNNSPFDNPVGSAAYQFVSPFYISDVNQTEVDKVLDDIYEKTGSEDVFINSKAIPKFEDGTPLTPEQNTEYTTYRGQEVYSKLAELFETDAFKNANYTEKLSMVKSLENKIDKDAINRLIDPNLEVGDYVTDIASDYENKALKNDMKEQGYPVNDFFIEAYQNNDTNVLDKAKTYQEQASKYTYTNKKGEEKTLEITKDLYEDLEKMSSESEKKEYIAYQGKCKELKIDASERGFDAYKKGKIEEFANDYKATLKELGMSDSETAYKEWLKTGSIGLREYASKQKREKAKQESQRVTALENVYGGKQVNNARDMYNKATKYIPKLTEAEWAVTYSQIDSLGKRNGEITQEEMFKYFKKNNKTEEEAQQYWKAYGNWKTIPYLKDGEWKTKKK